MTVRRSDAPLVRSSQLADALRTSREALTEVEGQLEALLALLRDPARSPDQVTAERLRGATRRADSAVASLGALARRR
jgi:hypothetical protein